MPIKPGSKAKPAAKKSRGKKTPFRAPKSKSDKAPALKKFAPAEKDSARRPADPGRTKKELSDRRDARAYIRERAAEKRGDEPTQKLHKLLAQSGYGSRRDMEQVIADGRVTVNSQPATIGMRISTDDVVRVDRRPIKLSWDDAETPRILIYHKPEGEIVSRDDPQGRATVFDKLPRAAHGRWIAVGRLDYNTSGLLIFTTSGELANNMTHPRFEVEREYAVRVMGELDDEKMHQLTGGVELEDGVAHFHSIRYEGGEAANHWYNVVLKEGRNREVRRMFAAVGVMVSRLMRTRFGIVNMPPRLKRGMWLELEAPQVKMITDWVAKRSNPQAEDVEPMRRGRQKGAGRMNIEELAEAPPEQSRKAAAAPRTAKRPVVYPVKRPRRRRIAGE
ncbi:MAG: pseudouridine synthase [Burkholderiales bacterium]